MTKDELRRKKIREYARKHYAKNKKRHMEGNKRWRQKNKARVNELNRKSRLRVRYNLSLETWAAMIKAGCNICGGYKKLCVDHDHTTGRVRGILCDLHNKGLGLFKDNVEHLLAAINYLTKCGGI